MLKVVEHWKTGHVGFKYLPSAAEAVLMPVTLSCHRHEFQLSGVVHWLVAK
jgi:hypothetical protein